MLRTRKNKNTSRKKRRGACGGCLRWLSETNWKGMFSSENVDYNTFLRICKLYNLFII